MAIDDLREVDDSYQENSVHTENGIEEEVFQDKTYDEDKEDVVQDEVNHDEDVDLEVDEDSLRTEKGMEEEGFEDEIHHDEDVDPEGSFQDDTKKEEGGDDAVADMRVRCY